MTKLQAPKSERHRLLQPQQGQRVVQSLPGQVRQEHPTEGVLALREVLPRLHWPGERQEEEGGGLPAHHHEGVWQARSGERSV